MELEKKDRLVENLQEKKKESLEMVGNDKMILNEKC
jgi:hypothetical protein